MTAPPKSVIAAYSALEGATFRPFGTGLINATFLAERAGERVVVQGLHPVFAGLVNEDIAALTAHLRARGMATTELLRTRDGRLWQPDENARPWRVLTFVDGVVVDRVDSPARAFEAGALVGRFHAAVADFEHDYAFTRPGVHDVGAHREKLVHTLHVHAEHRLYDEVATLADAAFAVLDKASPRDELPLRHAHGDLKISNLLFGEDGRGLSLIDLDTIAKMPLLYELGDALRSWTNPLGEDVESATVDLMLFGEALRGYASTAMPLAPSERDTLALGLPRIAAELAVRFLNDALEERYFGWNAGKYATRGDHNLARAKGQLALAEDAIAKLAELDQIVRRDFGTR